MMPLYIAGPITGLPDGNRAAFDDAETRLRAAGFEVFNPRSHGGEGEHTWLDYMRMSLHLIAECGGIATLPGVEESKGAVIEIRLVSDIGLPVTTVDTWIEWGGDRGEMPVPSVGWWRRQSEWAQASLVWAALALVLLAVFVWWEWWL